MTEYQELRVAGRSLYEKMIQASDREAFSPIRIAKRMTLPVLGRTLVMRGETDQAALSDYWLFEYRAGGRTLVHSVDPVAAGLSPVETELLQAFAGSRTSLFRAVAVRDATPEVQLQDLLEPERPAVWLTDIGLSETLRRLQAQVCIFLRLVAVRNLHMNSGLNFGFDPRHEPGLLQACRQKTKRVAPADLSEARFIFFYRKHLEIGLDQEYRDVC